MIFPIAVVTLLVLVADYYIDAACVNRLDVTRTSRFGTMAIIASALALSYIWNHPFIGQITNTQSLKDVMAVEHEISVGVIFSVALFVLGTLSIIDIFYICYLCRCSTFTKLFMSSPD